MISTKSLNVSIMLVMLSALCFMFGNGEKNKYLQIVIAFWFNDPFGLWFFFTHTHIFIGLNIKFWPGSFGCRKL